VRAINEVEIFPLHRQAWNDYELVAAIVSLHNRELLLENRRLADETRSRLAHVGARIGSKALKHWSRNHQSQLGRGRFGGSGCRVPGLDKT